MAEYISFQPSDFFNSVLYTGTGTTHTITGVGFQPDFVWGKSRSGAQSHRVIDAVRGGTKVIYPDLTAVEGTDAELITSFNSDGYVMGTSGTNANDNTVTYVSWNWKAGTTSGIATDGSTTITPSYYSFDQSRGISILKYEGTNTNNQKVAHGLGAVPQLIIIKDLEDAYSWCVYSTGVAASAWQNWVMRLDTGAPRVDNNTMWNDTAPDSVNFTLGDNSDLNPASKDCIAYCFTGKRGYSKFGAYIGNGNANGPFIYTGFRPAFIMMKDANGTAAWRLYDTKRLGYNHTNNDLEANTTAAEGTDANFDILSNGFKIRRSVSGLNTNGYQNLYAAFAEFPIVSSNDIPGVAK